jgi:tetratricopeptide (TPR) repeat protein
MRAHFIGQLLGFRFENSPYLSRALQDPQIFRDRVVTYLIDYFKAVASVGSIVLLLEDIHWADDSSLEVLKQLLEGLTDEPLLVVCTARPTFFERYPKWSEGKSNGRATFTLVHLAPLSQQNSQHLVEEILQKVEEVPESLRDLVVSRAEGNPFFMEEVIKMLIEEEVILKEDERWRIDLTHLAGVRIPTTLVEVLQARLDSLSLEERVLLQRASVLGRIFWDDAIGFMEQGLEDQVQISPRMIEVLFNLSVKEMVFSHEVSTFENTREFQFKHALLRDVTYESALKRLRRVYHAYAATWLETVTEQSRRSDEYAAMIAEHYERAADREKASTWYQRAGIQAADYYANAEAIRCLTRYLEISIEEDIAGRYDVLLRRAKLYDMVSNRQAQKQDLEALQALAEKLDAQDASEGRPGASRRAEVFLQWWFFFDAMGDMQASTTAAQQAIDLALASGAKEFEALGNLYLGATSWKQSNHPAAREHLERALALARAVQSPKMEADCLRNLGIVLQYQGNYSEARANYEDALHFYYEAGDERGESMLLNSLGSLLSEQGLYREARSYLERSLELKRKIGHRRAEHITLHNLGMVADRLGNFSEALDYLEQVLRFVNEMGDRDGEGDALLALGKVAFHLGDHNRAKACLEKALSITREIDSKISECDVLASLAYLAHRLGDDQAAYQLSQEALVLTRALNLPVEQAYSLTYAGHALLGLGRAEEAIENYLNGLELARPGRSTSQYLEIQAGLARAYLAQKRRDQALGIVEEIMTRLADISQVGADELLGISYIPLEGMEEPFRVLLTCFQVLKATNDSRAGTLLSAAHRLLREQADRIGDEVLRRSFLEKVPANREILAEWEAGKT